jgi:CBS domain-containing protein
VVVDPDNRPVGIFTDTDLRRLVAATGRSVDAPIRSIMRPDPASVHADALCFDALTAMVKGNFHHLPVLDQGKLFGVVTQHDLLLLSGGNPGSVVKDVESAPSLAQLALVQHNVDRLAEHLVRRDLGVPEIQDVITLINDRLTRRLIEIGLDEMKAEGLGSPPCPWAWVGMGSAGRKEQIMRTDQDCAIVYADTCGAGGDETGAWFRTLAEKIVAGLETCGFPRCREKNMADNPRRRQPVSVWREYFKTWLRETDPGALKSAGLFFDARFIYGREDLVHEIMRLIRHELLENRPFLTGLAVSALSAKPPLGFFRGFIVEKSGEHENRLNLKKNGLLPLVDAVRLLSLERRLPLTNTLDRLKALGQSGGLDPALAAEAAEAFNYMFILRMRNYVEGLAVARFSFDWVNPELLAGVERRALKEAFKVVARLQEAVAARFYL